MARYAPRPGGPPRCRRPCGRRRSRPRSRRRLRHCRGCPQAHRAPPPSPGRRCLGSLPSVRPPLSADTLSRVTAPHQELVVLGREALQRGDAAAAREMFERASSGPLDAEVVEGLASAAYLDLDFTRAVEEWERAYAAFREVGDAVGAVRVARTLSYMYG